MFDKILHASDGSEQAFQALALALALAKQNSSEMHVVCVEEAPYVSELIEEARDATRAAGGRIEGVLQRARIMAEERQVTLHTHVITGHPVRDIIRLAANLEADLLVIGARGHSDFYGRLIGSKAERITQLARCPVLVVKPNEAKVFRPTFDKILHAIDGSKHSFQALKLALALAKLNNSELHTVCVEELPYPGPVDENRPVTREVGGRIEMVLEKARAMAEQSQVTLQTHVLAGRPVHVIVKLAADLDADLLVFGAQGHSALYQRIIGSKADRMMQLAQCPVLVVK
jgi:nucleotide-binding universal stress UspA family protein